MIFDRLRNKLAEVNNNYEKKKLSGWDGIGGH
jgi:hypothetical protein